MQQKEGMDDLKGIILYEKNLCGYYSKILVQLSLNALLVFIKQLFEISENNVLQHKACFWK